MEIDQIRFLKIKKEAESYYKTIGNVYCPYLSGKVSFNTKGLEHLKFKNRERARTIKEQYVRLKLLKLAPYILEKSHTLQDFFETSEFEFRKINSRWEQRFVKVIYYGFVAIINQARIKIIVKEVEGGNKFFWSLIPFWKNNKKNTQGCNNKKILHSGDMQDD